MINFNQFKENKKTIALGQICFQIMETYGINSSIFFEWIKTIKDSKDISSNIDLWFDTEINFIENYHSEIIENFSENIETTTSLIKELINQFEYIKNHESNKISENIQNRISTYLPPNHIKFIMTNAEQSKEKLEDLLSKSQREGSVLNNKIIQTALNSIVRKFEYIKPNIIKKLIQRNPNQMTQDKQKNFDISKISADDIVLGHHSESVMNPLQVKLFEIKLKSVCYKLDEIGINPHDFVTCFVSEFCENNNINESNWLGGAWAGLKGAVKGGWERLMGGGDGTFWGAVQKGYRTGRDTRYGEYDKESIKDAIAHLKNFTSGIRGTTLQNFTVDINKLIVILNKILMGIDIAPAAKVEAPAAKVEAPAAKVEAPAAKVEAPAAPAPALSDMQAAKEFINNYPSKKSKIIPQLKKIFDNDPQMAKEISETPIFKSIMQRWEDKKEIPVNSFRDLSKVMKELMRTKAPPVVSAAAK